MSIQLKMQSQRDFQFKMIVAKQPQYSISLQSYECTDEGAENTTLLVMLVFRTQINQQERKEEDRTFVEQGALVSACLTDDSVTF